MDCRMCYHIIVLLFACISFCLLWSGYGMPGWLAITFQENAAIEEYTVSSLNRSLWYDVLCPQELDSCKACQSGSKSRKCVDNMNYPNYTSHFYWAEAVTEDKQEWVAWRVLMTIAVICCTVGLVLVACLVCCKFKTRVYRIIATVALFIWLVPAILVWIPVAMVADMHEDIRETIDNNIPHDATLHVPYSIIIVAIGAIMALIVALLLIWLTGVCSRDEDRKSETISDTYSTDSKMRIHTTNHVYGRQLPYLVPGPGHGGHGGHVTYYREFVDPYPDRPTEEVIYGDSYLKKGDSSNGFDNKSFVFSERVYDNRSNLQPTGRVIQY